MHHSAHNLSLPCIVHPANQGIKLDSFVTLKTWPTRLHLSLDTSCLVNTVAAVTRSLQGAIQLLLLLYLSPVMRLARPREGIILSR